MSSQIASDPSSLDAGAVSPSVRSFIMARIVEVATQQKRRLAPLVDNLPLLESGLDSLCVAILVASLDDHYNFDPFADDDVALPVTLGDFIALYRDAAV